MLLPLMALGANCISKVGHLGENGSVSILGWAHSGVFHLQIPSTETESAKNQAPISPQPLWEVEAEGPQVQNPSGLQNEFKARLGNFSGPSDKTEKGLEMTLAWREREQCLARSRP